MAESEAIYGVIKVDNAFYFSHPSWSGIGSHHSDPFYVFRSMFSEVDYKALLKNGKLVAPGEFL